MKRLDRMLLSYFFPVLFGGLIFGVLMLQLVELFQNLNRYMSGGVGWDKILLIQLYYAPKSVGWALPIALLFATNFSMGTLYSRNELIAVFTSGISIRRFTFPLLALGIFFSLFHLIFEDRVIVNANRQQRLLKSESLGIYESFSQSNVSFISARGQVVYNVVFYNFDLKEINQVTVVLRDEAGRFLRRIDAEKGDWADGGRLTLRKVRAYDMQDGSIRESWVENLADPVIQEDYTVFEQRMTKLEDLSLAEAIPFLQSLESSGLPTLREAQTDFYQRLAFAFTPFLVVWVSSAIGGTFRKNILLMSLLVSIGISVAFYVVQMVTGLMSRVGLIPPIIGAFTGVLLIGGAGFALYRRAKT